MRSVLFHIPLPEFLGFEKGIPIFGYGVMILVAWLTADFWARKRALQFNISGEHVQDITISALLMGVLGARITHFILYPEHYIGFLDFFKIYQGGLVLYGFILTSPLIIYIKLRKYKISWNHFFYIFMPVIPLGIGIGRIGCLLNGCCFGSPANYSWCIHFPEGTSPSAYFPNSLLHPSQIYAFLLGLILSLSLAVVPRILPKTTGFQLALYFTFGYGLIRLIEENFRGDTPRHFAGIFTAGQGISLILMSLSIVVFLFYKKQLTK